MPTRRIRLWDLPVRLAHWGFALLVPALWGSAELGRMDIHKLLGLILLGLVVFRLLWGIYGSETARFARFIKGPHAVLAHLRGRDADLGAGVAGHNPAGGWSVVALLGVMGAQAAIGLFTSDVDGVASGPLNHLVSYETGEWLREVHEAGFNLLLALVALHVAAIGFYAVVKKDRLVPPMVTGAKDVPVGVSPPRMAPVWQALPAMVLAAAFAWWLGMGAPQSLAQLTAPPPPSAEDYM